MTDRRQPPSAPPPGPASEHDSVAPSGERGRKPEDGSARGAGAEQARDPRRGDREGIRLVLLAGPSGSGKSRLVSMARCPRVELDNFYRDEDDPANPRTSRTVPPGASPAVDWDDVGSWDADGALAALVSLCTTGSAEIPVYDIAASCRRGMRTLDLGGARTFVAEGLFVPELVPACRASGLDMDAVYLDRSRVQTLLFRFVRDVSEHRKPLPVLLRRGLALFRAEPALRARALAAGCRPVSFAEALAVVRR